MLPGDDVDANCSIGCRNIELVAEPNAESSVILAKGLFFIRSETLEPFFSPEKKHDFSKNMPFS